MANQNVFILVSLGLLACLVRLTVSQDYCRVSSLSNGVHAHPTTCNQYILCLDGATRTYSCPPQLVFDPVVRACVDSSIAHPCNPSTAGQVTSASQGYCALYSWPSGVHPHPTTCQLYILCEQGITHVLPCSSGLLFDLVYGACVDANIANPCHATTAPPVTAVNQDYCRLHGMVNGIHSHPLTCQQYILCTNGNTHIYSCESGLLFEATFNACVDNHLAVTCSNHGVTVNPVTSAVNQGYCRLQGLVNGTYRHPVICNQFISCQDGVTYVNTCAGRLLFDAKINTCVDGRLAAPCSNQVATVIPVISDLETVCERYKLPEGIYPHPDKCELFIECLDGSTNIVKCPGGLQYNLLSSSCSHQSAVNCSNNLCVCFQDVSVNLPRPCRLRTNVTL